MKTFSEWLVDEHPDMVDEAWRDWAKAAALTTALATGALPTSASAAEPANTSVATSKLTNKDDKQLDVAFKEYQYALKLGRTSILNAAERKLLNLTITNFSFLRDKNGNTDKTIKNIEVYLQKGGRQNQSDPSNISTSTKNPNSSTIQTRSESPDLASEGTRLTIR